MADGCRGMMSSLASTDEGGLMLAKEESAFLESLEGFVGAMAFYDGNCDRGKRYVEDKVILAEPSFLQDDFLTTIRIWSYKSEGTTRVYISYDTELQRSDSSGGYGGSKPTFDDQKGQPTANWEVIGRWCPYLA